MSEYPLVSIVVLSLNGSDVIRDCLSTLLVSDYPNYEVLVVNNGSTDATAEIVANEYPQVRLISLPFNYGFAGGINEGLKAARGEILVPLNDDTLITPTMVREIVRPIIEEEKVAMVGCKILYPDKKTIQHAGAVIRANGLTDHFGYGEEDEGQHDKQLDVEYVTGCAMAIPRDIFKEIGLFDDRFHPTYYEEVDFAVKVRKAGYRVVYAPRAVLYHLESKTEIRYSKRFLYRFNKSRLRFVLKNFSLKQIVAAVAFEIKWLVLLLDMPSRKALAFPLLKAYLATLIRLPVICYDRYFRFLPIGDPPEAEKRTSANAGS